MVKFINTVFELVNNAMMADRYLNDAKDAKDFEHRVMVLRQKGII